ncbi:MAG: hypothetical protein ACLFV7_02600 [Phycisphaerae bacterium]
MNRYRSTCGWAVVMMILTAWAATAAGEQICRLELQNALPREKPMNVYLALDGKQVTAAFASAPTFNTMPYTVDTSGLSAGNGRLHGEIKVTVPSDGWVPAGGKSLECEYRLDIDLAAGKATGKFTGSAGDSKVSGKVEGTVSDAPKLPERYRVELRMRSATRTRKGLRRVGVEMGLRDGKPIGVKLIPHGSITDIGAATIARKATVSLEGNRLSGRVEGTLQKNGQTTQSLVVGFECTVVGTHVAGSYRATIDGGNEVTGGCQGRLNLSPVPEPGDAIWKLTLQQGVRPGKMINVFLSTSKGRIGGAFAVTPNFNNATHEVDTGKLKLKDGRLHGPITVTVFPDAWIPKDHKKMSARYTIDARLKDAEVVGRFDGVFGERKVSGDIEGHVESKPKVGKVAKATIKPEGGLYNGSWSGYRAFFTFELEDGKITGGRVWNNHDDALKGTVESGTFEIGNEMLTAEFVATVKPGTSAKPGRYTIRVHGPVMGTVSCGNSTSKLEDKTWTSRYWASWKYE